jgi:CTP:molybdopterin cytidylyltransferase MocA
MDDRRIGSIILAAGDSSRMGTPKALLRLEKRTFLERIVDAHSGISDQICLVLGRHAPQVLSQMEIQDLRVCLNQQPDRGPLSSIQIGLQALEQVDAVIVHPVDHPLVSRSTIQRLSQNSRIHPERILIPLFEGRKGHPVLFPRRFFKELFAAPLDQGARWVVRKNRSSVTTFATDDSGILENINIPEDLRRLSIAPPAKSPKDD